MWNLTVFLCVVWAVSLLYGEMFAFWVPSLWSCSWPHHHRGPSSPPFRSSAMNGGEFETSNYVKVAVLADPQLMDRTSLRLSPKSLILEIAQFYTDLFMRRAFLASVSPFKPDVILFLGDYFDGGPSLSDEEWQESWSRFRHIFNLNTHERTAKIPLFYIPGNHDIGYAAVHSRMPEVIRRYEKVFGKRNYLSKVGKVDFIAVDAQTLDGHPQGNLTVATWNYVRNVSWDPSSPPRVLLTHIPLYRPDWTLCGAHRSSPIINQRVSRAAHDQEILYQNYITEEKTKDLLDSIRPVLVLSAHDHDQCTVTHTSKHGPVKEHTLGTTSWQQGNLYPSFMLLSATNLTSPNASSVEEAILSQLCFLPVQTYIYIWYLSLFVLSLLAILLWPTSGVGLLPRIGDFMGCIRGVLNIDIFKSVVKEKTEDENCVYEELWDAEGSMHLIKKTLKAPLSNSSETTSMEKGNAVMRSTTKKPVLQATEFSIPMEVNVLGVLDAGTKAAPARRSNKSTTRVVIQRVLRTFRVLTVVAAVNLPLYMMLLFKDWIDK